MEYQEINEKEESYNTYKLSSIDGYDENYKYKNEDIIRVYGDMYEITGLNRGDFVGKLIKKNGSSIKEQIISVFNKKKREEINKKKEKIKEMTELTKELRQKYTVRRGKRTERIKEIEKIWPRYEDKDELEKIKEKLEKLDNEFLRNINEYCKKDDIDSLKKLKNYEQLNKEYNETIKDLEEKFGEIKEEQNKHKRKAEQGREDERKTGQTYEEGQNKQEKEAIRNAKEQDAKEQVAKDLYRKLIKKYHPDSTGTTIISEILRRNLTDPEKEQLKNELDKLRQLNNKIIQEINSNKYDPESLKKRENYNETNGEYINAVNNLKAKLLILKKEQQINLSNN